MEGKERPGGKREEGAPEKLKVVPMAGLLMIDIGTTPHDRHWHFILGAMP